MSVFAYFLNNPLVSISKSKTPLPAKRIRTDFESGDPEDDPFLRQMIPSADQAIEISLIFQIHIK